MLSCTAPATLLPACQPYRLSNFWAMTIGDNASADYVEAECGFQVVSPIVA